MLLIPDTNFLVYCAKYGIFDEIEKFNAKMFLPEQVVSELKMLSKSTGKGKDKGAAALALSFVNKLQSEGKIIVEKTEKKAADDAIVEMALEKKEKEIAVATHDRELMKRLKKAKISIIGIRQKKYLAKI